MMPPPKLSIILATRDTYQTIRATIAHHRRQSIVDQLELVIVCPSKAGLGFDPANLTEFAKVTIAEVGRVQSVAQANAAGVRAASAPVVVLSEDHAFPDPNWAEILLKRHEEDYAVVGPVVRNANTYNGVSWADFIIGYGEWAEPGPSHTPHHLPGHNSSYKRDVLLSYGDQLEPMLSAESVLHWDLQAKGHRIFLERSAHVAHFNFALWSSWLPVQFYMGRSFAASRARNWGMGKKLLWTLAGVLIPGVRAVRVVRHAMEPARKTHRRCLARSLPAMLIGLAIDGVGQMAGFAFGPGRSERRLCELEFERVNHVLEPDRAAIAKLATV